MHLICGCGAEIHADDMFGHAVVRDWQQLHKGCAVIASAKPTVARDADQCRIDYLEKHTTQAGDRQVLFSAIIAHRQSGKNLRTTLDILRS